MLRYLCLVDGARDDAILDKLADTKLYLKIKANYTSERVKQGMGKTDTVEKGQNLKQLRLRYDIKREMNQRYKVEG